MNTAGKSFHPEQAQAFDAETRKMVNQQKTIDRLLKVVLATRMDLQKFRENSGSKPATELRG